MDKDLLYFSPFYGAVVCNFLHTAREARVTV